MDPQTLASFTTQLKGAPFSILFVMVELDRPTGPEELIHFTGYSAQTVRNGLSRLAFMGLAERHRRFHGWILTPRGRGLFGRGDAPGCEAPATPPAPQPNVIASADPGQPAIDDNAATAEASAEAPMAPPAPVGAGANSPSPAPHPQPSDDGPSLEDAQAPVEGEFSSSDREKIAVAPCSCGRYTHGSSMASLSRTNSEPEQHELQTTTCRSDRQNLPVAPPSGPLDDPEAEAAVAALRACGCPGRTWNGKGARDAVEQAMALGWSGAEVMEAVEAWFAYIDSPAGHTIKSKGFFTMSQLRIGEMPPPRSTWGTAGATSSAASRDALARSYIEAQFRRIVRH